MKHQSNTTKSEEMQRAEKDENRGGEQMGRDLINPPMIPTLPAVGPWNLTSCRNRNRSIRIPTDKWCGFAVRITIAQRGEKALAIEEEALIAKKAW